MSNLTELTLKLKLAELEIEKLKLKIQLLDQQKLAKLQEQLHEFYLGTSKVEHY